MKLWTDLREFFFPRICPICGKKLLLTEEILCTGCLTGLPYTHILNSPGNEMERSFWGRFPIRRASSLCYYARGSKISSLLHDMKYHGARTACIQMGELLASELHPSGFFEGIDCLIPVPLHPRRQRTRGYNQSELLARGISAFTGIPVCTDALHRIHHNPTQTHKHGYERWLNAENLFALSDKALPTLQHKHIMLVDDVLTTGATLTACADVLVSIPGIQISLVTLAWAKGL